MHTVLRYDEKPHLLSRCLFATGRSCILHLLRKFDPDVVFVPELHPAGVMDPIRHLKLGFEVYRVLDNFEIDLGHLQELMTVSGCKRPLVVVIHYFGYWLQAWGAAALAHKFGGVLFEDCAHCLPTEGTRLCGDVRLYSYNKLFPVIDGAVMFSCSPQVDLTRLPGSKDLEPLQQEAVEAYALHLASNRIIAAMPTPKSQLEWDRYAEAEAVSRKAYNDYYKVISQDMEPRSMVSLEFLGQYDHEKEKRRRVKHAEKLLENISGDYRFRDDVPVFALPVRSARPAGDVRTLLESGIEAHALGSLWNALPGRAIYDELLMLPLRKKYDLKQIETIRTLFL